MSNELLLTKLDKYIKMFINEKKVLNCSINTITSYTAILNEFYEYIVEVDGVNNLEEINRENILNFLNSNEKSSNSSQILKLSVIKSFFIFIDDKEKLGGLFELRFKKLTIKRVSTEVDALNSQEVDRLLSILKYKKRSFNRVRDSLLIKLILFTGIRASESLGIKMSDISLIEDESVYKLKIAGKGSKERFVYIKKVTIEDELEFLLSAGYIENYIAVTKSGRVMSRVGLYKMISNKMKKARIAKSGVHILRHTFARDLVSKNINLSTISELLGHADITLTARTYAKSNEESKIRAVCG